MDLEMFVSAALTQIAKGIQSAQDYTLETGAVINPKTEFGDLAPKNALQVHGFEGGKQVAQVVSFDLSVTVSDASKTSGEGGIQVWGVKLGGGVGAETSSSSLSRISFTVPVLWPPFDYEKARATRKAK